MYKRIKRCFFISLFSIIIPSLSYAAAYNVPACKKGDIRLPCDNNRWEFSGDALYYTNGSVTDFKRSLDNTRVSISLSREGADYGWGYRLGTGFYFSTANALLLDWSHYRNTTSGIRDRSRILGDFSSTSKFDIINLSLSQKIDIGELFHLAFIEGLQYADLVSDLREQTTSPETSFDSNSLKGGGVRMGLEGSYDLAKNSFLFVKLAFGLLYDREVRTQTARHPTRTSLARQVYNQVTWENDMSIGVNNHKSVYRGTLTSRVAWDSLYYGRGNGFNWSGLRFGLKYLW